MVSDNNRVNLLYNSRWDLKLEQRKRHFVVHPSSHPRITVSNQKNHMVPYYIKI